MNARNHIMYKLLVTLVAHYIIANSFDWSISVGYIGAYCTFL